MRFCSQDELRWWDVCFKLPHTVSWCAHSQTQLEVHSQASHLMFSEIFDELPQPQKRTLKFQALILVNPFSKLRGPNQIWALHRLIKERSLKVLAVLEGVTLPKRDIKLISNLAPMFNFSSAVVESSRDEHFLRHQSHRLEHIQVRSPHLPGPEVVRTL